jgi:hypothetical protein
MSPMDQISPYGKVTLHLIFGRVRIRGLFRRSRICPVAHLPEQLVAAIGDYIDLHNEDPKRFIWTAKASDILEKIVRARAALHK